MEIKENGTFNSNKMTNFIKRGSDQTADQNTPVQYNVSRAHNASDYYHQEFIQLPKEQSN
jgi:hypothetical protein